MYCTPRHCNRHCSPNHPAVAVFVVLFGFMLPTRLRCTFEATQLCGVLQGAYPIDEELQVGICHPAGVDTPADTFL